MTANTQNEMSNQEIIDLLVEAEFDEAHIKLALAEITSRDFQSVVDYIETKKTESIKKEEKERIEKIEQAKKHAEQLKQEAEYDEILKKRVLEKIAANRQEVANKEHIDSVEIKKPEIDAFLKVKITTPQNTYFLLGFGEEDTLVDLYNKVIEKTGGKKIVLAKYGHGSPLSKSNQRIFDFFRAKTVMLSILEE